MHAAVGRRELPDDLMNGDAHGSGAEDRVGKIMSTGFWAAPFNHLFARRLPSVVGGTGGSPHIFVPGLGGSMVQAGGHYAHVTSGLL